jgi:ABC-type sugar transport system ATPase subunit
MSATGERTADGWKHEPTGRVLPAESEGSARAIPQLLLADVRKRFGGVRALRGARMELSRPGVVHGLIGANGSGKSTLLGILSGQQRPDAGTVAIDGAEVVLSSPLAALRHGIAMVAQETALAPDLSIAENVFLGGRLVRRRVRGIDWRATNARAAALLGELGLHEDPATPVSRLRPDRRQMVEIARALSLDARILILDEPTSSLGDDEVAALFAAVRRLQGRGVSTIFVSHRLPELLALSDELTVLRDGETVAAGPVAAFDADRIVEAMVGPAGAERAGRRTRPPAPSRPRDAGASGDDAPAPGDGAATAAAPAAQTAAPAPAPALRLRGLAAPGLLSGIDLDVGAGEVVGLAGVVGAGRSELLEAVFGVLPATGSVELHGEPLTARDPREAIAAGVGYLPPDRKHQGLVLQRSVADNLAMVATRDAGRLRAPGGAAERALVREAVETMRIVAASPAAAVSTLSGGNQQKVALGKWIAARSRVLLLDEPTRGVDVAAKAEIHRLLRAAAADGAALLVSSSETGELLELCDRVVVLSRGAIVASLTSEEASEEVLARFAGGHA